jgi:OmpA-OmpF porin, OOP family
VTFGGQADAQGAATATAAGSADSPTPESAAERDKKLDEGSVLTGGVGLLHTQHAQGGAAGQFRVAFTTEYFSAGFLCSTDFPCPNPQDRNGPPVTDDSSDHIGGRLSLSMQVLKWLEPYLATSAFANSNPANRPSLLQVLGDTTMGAKAHGALSPIFHVGGAFELWLVNGTGAVGLDGAGTSAKLRGLGTADFRAAEKPIPLRVSTNLTYVLDNSGEVVNGTERERGTSISRIERYGLNINRVDHLDVHLGAELFVSKERVRPFLEYQMAIPINRQGYECRDPNPSRDKCLQNHTLVPSSLTFGGRFFPWKRGFNLLVAFDVGISGVGTFIEEMRPTPPWMFYAGAGWAFDTVDRPPVVRDRFVDRPVVAGGRRIRGFVHEAGRQEGIANAIVAYDNHPELTRLATGEDGRFTTHDLLAGPYVFSVKAEGYKIGQCSTTLAGPPPGAPASTQAGGEVQLDCPVEALPRFGSLVGHVKDAEAGGSVPSAALRVVDATKKEQAGATDATGSFRFEQIGPGEAHVTADADGYLATTETVDIKVRQDNKVEIALRKKSKTPLVTVQAKEIIIKQQIQFASDSAVILPESNGLLTEIADVLVKNPRIHRVEVQGHTDNTGTAERNKQLSEDRANAVVAWLTSHGVARDRLVGRGFGQSKPIVPNVTPTNRARNRRVQFIIIDQDPATKKH